MVKTDNAASTRSGISGFRPLVGAPAGVEIVNFSRLRCLPRNMLSGLQRPHFHQLIVPTSGTLHLMVDFVDHVVSAGTWIWVRPGQIQRWGDLTEVEGELILFENGFLDTDTTSLALIDYPGAASLFRAEDGGAELEAARVHLAREFNAFGDLPLSVHLMTLRQLLAVLVLRLSHTNSVGRFPGTATDTFRRFRMAVERDFTRARRVEQYATMLGYSPRTLTRVTRTATGSGAKEFIDQRVVLEAKRLLAHSDDSVARIACDLGFDDAANFSMFFQHRAKQTPADFRAAAR